MHLYQLKLTFFKIKLTQLTNSFKPGNIVIFLNLIIITLIVKCVNLVNVIEWVKFMLRV